MSRITHFKVQPKNIQYWDYYILCHLDVYAAIALQRFEYWDGTKRDGNVHAEDINDILEDIGEEITQDVSRFFYKAQDELQWELMGLTGETYTANLVNFLIKDLNYLEQRNNPSNAMDRRKQYLFHDELVQDHVNYLGYIIDYFKRLGFNLNPIYYAIEQLTAAKVYIDTLNIALVTDKLTKMYAQMEEDEAKTKESKKYKPGLPKFIRMQLGKDKDLLPRLNANKLKRFRNFTEWKAQNYGMESVETRDAICKNTDSIPQNYGSNNNNYNQQLQSTTTSRENEAGQQNPNKTTKQRSSSRSSTHPEKQKEEITLTEGGRRIYDFACDSKLFKARRPKITPKIKEECEELAEHIKTFEQFLSLLRLVQSNPKLKAPYHLKNMINALNAWRQLQDETESPATTTTVPSEKPQQITNLLEMLQYQEAMETKGVLR
jgi:hypothetical protein